MFLKCRDFPRDVFSSVTSSFSYSSLVFQLSLSAGGCSHCSSSFFFLSYTLFLLTHHMDVSIELLDHYSWGFPGQLLLSYEEANAWDPIIGHEGKSTLNGS